MISSNFCFLCQLQFPAQSLAPQQAPSPEILLPRLTPFLFAGYSGFDKEREREIAA